MQHITGSTIAKPKTVKVEFMSDEQGAIFVSTCANVITLPRGVLTSNNRMRLSRWQFQLLLQLALSHSTQHEKAASFSILLESLITSA